MLLLWMVSGSDHGDITQYPDIVSVAMEKR